jgi:uncharacterized membrane protein
MIIAEINSYSVSVFIHVSAVVVGLGATFAEAVMFPVAMRAGARYLPYVHRLQLAINQRLASPALLVILITGIYQVTDADLEFGEFWISGTLTIVVILGALLGAYFIPSDRRLAPMIEAEVAAAGDGPVKPSEDYMRKARVQGVVGGLAGLLTIAAVFLMVTKPGA